MTDRNLALALAAALVLAACSKTDVPAEKKASGPRIEASAPSPEQVTVRQFERNVLEPPAPWAPAPPPPGGDVAEPPAAGRLAERAKPPPASAPGPAGAEPPAAARGDLALARPGPAPESAAVRVVSKVAPDYPREAVRAGVDEGVVRARMTIDASGAVARVDIVEARPRRVFDAAVTRALSQWKFNEGAPGRTYDAEVVFRR